MTDLQAMVSMRRKAEIYRRHIVTDEEEGDQCRTGVGNEEEGAQPPTQIEEPGKGAEYRIRRELEEDEESGQQSLKVHFEFDPDPVVVRDPDQMAQMAVKLLEAKRQQLLEVQHIMQHLRSKSANVQESSEVPDAYVASTFNRMEKAVAFYHALLDSGL